MFGPPPGYVPSATEKDLQERWLPTEEQVAEAVAALKALPAGEREDSIAAVALAQPGKTYGLWEMGQEVVPVPGVWVGRNSFEVSPSYGEARMKASAAASAWLKSQGKTGTVAYVAVYEDGTAAVFEDFSREVA